MRRVDPANINPEAGLPLFEAAALREQAAELRRQAAEHPPIYRHIMDIAPGAPVGAPVTTGFRIYKGGMDAGAIARDLGAAAALDAEARKHELAWAIRKAAQSFPEFTTDEVRDILAEIGVRELEHPNALSAAVLAAAREGIIEEVNKAPRRSTRPEARRRKLTIWRKAEVQP